MIGRRQLLILTLGGIFVVLLVVGTIALSLQTHTVNPQKQPATYTAKALSELPQYDKSGIDMSHLANNLLPPTNRWFTGAALQSKPEPIFPLPLKVTPTDTQFSFDLPKIKVDTKLIQAVDNLPITVSFAQAHHYRVTRYDEASVDLTYYTADNREIATVTVVAGSPYIFISSHTDTSYTIKASGSTPTRHNNAIEFLQGETVLGAAPFNGAQVTSLDTEAKIAAPNNSFVTLFAAANPSDDDILLQNAGNRVVGTAVSFTFNGKNYQSSLLYKTANNKPTFYALLPHQGGHANGPAYDTIYGRVKLEQGNNLEYQTKAIDLQNQLDLAKLSNDDKQLLIQTLKDDISHVQPYPTDTYFAGKMLYHDAELLSIAKQLDQTTIADQLQARLRVELTTWLTPNGTANKSFYYDSKVHGVVGSQPSFGSEAFNDHHFHYGYFIYAASVLAQYDPSFKSGYKDKVNVLVADIANGAADANFPSDRMYDPYFGHSWASGSAPFADGNNQESSSEAINAWIGIGLWAKQTDDNALADRAGWLLSNEVAAASSYWMNFNTSVFPYNAGYGESVVAMNWGGKRDYATFFSTSPKAMLGIQLIPMSPTTSAYLSSYGGRIAQQLREARGGQTTNGEQFDDYLLMYEALEGGDKAALLQRAKTLPDSAVDSANSRTYLYAWILTK